MAALLSLAAASTAFAATAHAAAAAAPPGPSAPGSPGNPYQNAATLEFLEALNKSLARNYGMSLLAFIGLLLAITTAQRWTRHRRRLASLGPDGAAPSDYGTAVRALSAWKTHVLYAPLLHYRRAREVKLSPRLNLGTLPTRFQAAFILLIIVTNVFASTWDVPWASSDLQSLPILRHRTGTLAVVNFIPIMVMATVQNPLIAALDISYDSFNLMHRWFGRISVVQAVVHTLCWLVGKVQGAGWAAVGRAVHVPFIYTGLISTIAMVLIFLQSPKLVRYLSYEFFWHLHVVLVILTLIFLWQHLAHLPQRYHLMAAVAIWVTARLARFLVLMYRSIGRQGTSARVEAMGGDALRVTLRVQRPWTYRPGQSIYLTLPAAGLWTAHPFSVCWSDCQGPRDAPRPAASPESTASTASTVSATEKTAEIQTQEPAVESAGERTVSLIVKKHSGLTQKLWARARQSDTPLSLKAYVEGPYGTGNSLTSYGTVMLFASGVGITHQLGYVKALVDGHRDGTVATRSVTFVWVVPTTEALEWVQPWMHEILEIEGRRDVLKILLYVTSAGWSHAIKSPSETVQMFRGRPDVETLVRDGVDVKNGAVALSVCAGGGLSDEVRRVARVMLGQGANLDFFEAGFGW